jgi:adenylate kinase
MNLLLFGPPASGKGTQADMLIERLGITPIATGNILRAELAQGTALGVKARAYMQRGELVPDSVMIDIIRDRLRRPDRRDGFLLDGFSRTVPQAEALDSLMGELGISLDRVLFLNVPVEDLVRRISGRLTCTSCGRTYFFDPGQPRPENCEADGMFLAVREDDRPETARRRIAVYLRETLPVLDFYRHEGLVAEVDGRGPVEEVAGRLLRALPVAAGRRAETKEPVR